MSPPASASVYLSLSFSLLSPPPPLFLQVTILLANSDGSAKVPLDFILRVLDTKPAFNAEEHTFELCSGNYEPCPDAGTGNHFVPRLQLLGSVVTDGFCAGNLSRATPATPFGDLGLFAFPCALNTWSGVEMQLEARAHDADSRADNRVRVASPRRLCMSVHVCMCICACACAYVRLLAVIAA